MREQNAVIDLQPVPRQGRRSTGTSAGIHPDDTNSLSGDLYNTRLPSSSVVRNRPQQQIRVTYHDEPFIPRRASMQAPTTQAPVAQTAGPKKRHLLAGKPPMFYFVCILLIGLTGWFLISVLLAWVQGVSDQMHCGYPRTYQVDMNVGHGGVSHFTVENLNGHIVVYELPNDDPSKTLVYSGPTFSDANVPAIITFKADNSGKVTEMDIDVDNTQIPFLNGNDGKFHPQGQQGGS